MGGLNNFYELHDQCGVVEVHITQSAGVLDTISKQGRYHVAGVGAENGVLADDIAQLTEKICLYILDSNDAFDYAVHACNSLLQRRLQVEASIGCRNLLLGHTTLSKSAGHIILMPLRHGVQNFGFQVIDRCIETVNRSAQCDLASHKTTANNTYLLKFYSITHLYFCCSLIVFTSSRNAHPATFTSINKLSFFFKRKTAQRTPIFFVQFGYGTKKLDV